MFQLGEWIFLLATRRLRQAGLPSTIKCPEQPQLYHSGQTIFRLCMSTRQGVKSFCCRGKGQERGQVLEDLESEFSRRDFTVNRLKSKRSAEAWDKGMNHLQQLEAHVSCSRQSQSEDDCQTVVSGKGIQMSFTLGVIAGTPSVVNMFKCMWGMRSIGIC